MTAKEQIRRLEDLLSRVQTRAQEPRAGGVAYAAAEPAPYVESPIASVAVSVSFDEPEPDSLPPDTAHGDNTYAASDDAEVEVSSEVVEVDIDIDEPISHPVMESGAQPVALPTMPPEELEDAEDELPLATQPSLLPPPEEHAPIAAAPANEIEEEAPSSSRRPIAGEEPAESYSEESAPRHTPPPESGKQVTAPSVHPAARGSEPSFNREEGASGLNPSAPPPSLEGHTLVGGWREPGLGPQVSPAATTGVRVPAPPAATAASSTSPAIPAATSGTRLSPEVSRPDLPATANVARIEGSAPVARPTTMGELLDLTLSL